MSEEIKEKLAEVDIFRDLNDKELDALVSISTIESYGRNRTIFQKGDRGNSLYILKKGAVIVGIDLGDRFSRFARLEEGEIFGELSMFDDKPRSATVRVTGNHPVELIVIEKKPFFNLVKQNLEVGIDILIGMTRKITGRLRRADNTLRSLHSALKQYTRDM